MRAARLQSQDLARTQQFISTLLSKDEIKNEPKPDGPEPGKPLLVNGAALPLRTEPKPRFSDPPAPPPQQPLPEKPPHASDVPSLKRGTTERPKSNTSPIQPGNLQILQLTEALQSAKRELDTRQAQLRDLEDLLNKEREARKSAEELARRLEDAAAAAATRTRSPSVNGAPALDGQDSILDETFDPPAEAPSLPNSETVVKDAVKILPQQVENIQSRLETMGAELQAAKREAKEFRERAETAEAERESLAGMIKKIRQREEEDAAKAAQRGRSKSAGRKMRSLPGESPDAVFDTASEGHPSSRSDDDEGDQNRPTLSRANTITALERDLSRAINSDSAAVQSIPYASMLGVVLIGMGLMAYINGWQPQPRISR
jgi:chromosome segregation ATPase